MPQPTADRPWLAAYADGVPADIDIPDEPLTELLDRAARDFPDRVALDFLGRTTTYRDLAAAVACGAGVLRDHGVGHGDRVAVVLPNCPQHIVAFYATLRRGAAAVEHNPLYPAEELGRQMARYRPTAAVVWDKLAADLDPVLRRTGAPRPMLGVHLPDAMPSRTRAALRLPVPPARRARREITGPVPPAWRSWDRLLRGTAPVVGDSLTGDTGVGAGDVAALLHTGGTTGSPKLAVLTHRNLRANVEQGRAWTPELRRGEETILAALPMFHAYGLTLCMTFSVAMAATLVLVPRFDVTDTLKTIERTRPSFFPGVPLMYSRLADEAQRTGADISSVRVGISGAAPLSADIAERWERASGGMLIEGYGMTESSPITVGNPLSDRRRPGSIGVPFPSTQARVVDPDDPSSERPVGERGELLVRGPQIFQGYLDRAEETAGALIEGGWLRTGDLAVMDDEGFFTIVDRIKEVVITGGFNVYPSEVEDVLREHADVADVAIVGLRQDDGSEHVAAAVVAADGREVDPDALRRWARGRLAGYQTPKVVRVVEELPRDLIGKVRRREVLESFERQ